MVSLLLRGTKAIAPANVITISRSLPDELKKLQKEQDDSKADTSLIIFQGDVCSEQDNEKVIQQAISKWGRLDALILNAGVIEFARLADMSPSSFSNQMNINVCSTATTLHYAIPYLRKSPTGCGKVIFVSSGSSVGNSAAWSAYSASKAALNAVARTLATEEEDIASFSIRPGVVATSMQEQLRSTGEKHMSAENYKKFTKMHTDGELLAPEQPGHVMAALAINGTRSHPKESDGKGAGSKGSFLNWNDDVFSDFQYAQ